MIFVLKIYENNIFFYFLKIIFNISISKTYQNDLKILRRINFKQNKIQNIMKYNFNHKNKHHVNMGKEIQTV